ncbi:hypothetical protein ROP_40330 [Rhodococcus opacus B4]|uniref:Terminase n=1 Tax=Rhodococcus opacus (strain B4) TaxID=632772 RepID=C1B9C7_RHOOB|nr:hypothetical protein ROP_40330 [Rhodococcus opacus B4]
MDLDEWQQHVLIQSLGRRKDSKWSSFEVALLVPRQNGKGAVIEARELAGLFLIGEQTLLHSAHEFKTAKEAYLRIKQLIEQTPELNDLTKQFRFSNEDVSVELHPKKGRSVGARLKFVARSKGSGRGFSGDLNILDEAYELPDEALAALMPTMSARDNPQLWYTSSAPLPHSAVLRRVQERGRQGGRRLAYFEWSAPDDADLDDHEAWRLANPGYGIRIDDEFIESEREAMTDGDFARERLGIADVGRRDAPIGAVLWKDCGDVMSTVPDGNQVALGLAVSLDRTQVSLAVAGRNADGLLHVELLETRTGTDWLYDMAMSAYRGSDAMGIGLDPSTPAGGLMPKFREAEAVTVMMSAREVCAAAGLVYDETHADRLRHTGNQPALNAAVAGATKRNIGSSWGWGRVDTSVDITPLEAISNAAYAFMTLSGKQPKQRTGKVW